MTDTLATHRAWVQALILNRSSRELTEWEAAFVVSVARHIEAGRFLSDKQAAILERVYNDQCIADDSDDHGGPDDYRE